MKCSQQMQNKKNSVQEEGEQISKVLQPPGSSYKPHIDETVLKKYQPVWKIIWTRSKLTTSKFFLCLVCNNKSDNYWLNKHFDTIFLTDSSQHRLPMTVQYALCAIKNHKPKMFFFLSKYKNKFRINPKFKNAT